MGIIIKSYLVRTNGRKCICISDGFDMEIGKWN